MLKYLILPKIQNIIDIKGVLLQRFINFKIKKLSSGDVKSEYMPDQQLAEELQKIWKTKSTLIFLRQEQNLLIYDFNIKQCVYWSIRW